jgi:hypothetical protein
MSFFDSLSILLPSIFMLYIGYKIGFERGQATPPPIPQMGRPRHGSIDL